jgi:outer membrane cobalamin receptor
MRKSGSLARACLALGLLMVADGAAQERVIPLDTVRATSTSRAASELATPTRAVEVVTKEQIRAAPVSTIADILDWAFGVDLMPRSPALVDVGIRGSSFEQVLVMVDGVRVGDAQTGHFHLNLAVPLDQVERIEVLRGPASTLHGADAFGGVIHVVTRREGSGVSARAEAGSFASRALAASGAVTLLGLRADAAGELRTSDGHRPGTDSHLRTARLALSAPLAGGTARMDLGAAARDFGADGFYGPFPSYEETRTGTAALRWTPAEPARFSLEPLLSARRNSDDFILRRADPAGYRNQHETLQLGGELLARAALGGGVRLAAGLERYQERLESATLGDRSEARSAALLELAGGRLGGFTASAGVRRDWHQAFDTFWSPSAAFAWWPAAGVRVRASTGRAFRSPSWTDRYYRDPANVGDPNLRPERAWSSEAGVSTVRAGGLHLAAGVFERRATDLIDWAKPETAVGEPWVTRNVDAARFRGLEAEVGHSGLLGVRTTARGSWISVRSSGEAGYLSKYALRPLVENVTLSAERGLGERFTLHLRGHRNRRTGEEAYLRMDGRAALLHGPVRLFADLRNASDEPYLDIAGNPAPGRSLHLGVELR